jgi:CubicO group peptidase (beta-lactamase class C family)
MPVTFGRTSHLLRQGVSQGVFPGAALAFGNAKQVYYLTEGQTTSGGEQVTPQTLYDIASLTKLFTATAAMLLLEDGVLRLDDPVSGFLHQFEREDKRGITIRQLLTHTSGLAAHAPLFLSAGTSEEMVSLIADGPLSHEPGAKVVYSCLGFITLGLLLAKVSGQGLDELVYSRIFKPLDMPHTKYANGSPLPRDGVAPTEECSWRGRLIWGEVHDENAYAQGGVSGNAGLFSSAEDLAVFCQMILCEGKHGNSHILSVPSIKLATRNHTGELNENRGLGWQRKNPLLSWFGDLAPDSSFGHTGFTGTSLLICPEIDLFVVLLTNRVHPTRTNDRHVRFRALLHNALISDWTSI